MKSFDLVKTKQCGELEFKLRCQTCKSDWSFWFPETLSHLIEFFNNHKRNCHE